MTEIENADELIGCRVVNVSFCYGFLNSMTLRNDKSSSDSTIYTIEMEYDTSQNPQGLALNKYVKVDK